MGSDDRRWVLAVDHGTTSTVGATAELDPGDGWVRIGVVHVGGATAVPSVVLSRPDGTVLAGAPALDAGHGEPAAAVQRARSHLAIPGGPRLVLSHRPRPTTAVDVATALVATVLRAERARRGSLPTDLVLLHPATWGSEAREALRHAGRDALAAADPGSGSGSGTGPGSGEVSGTGDDAVRLVPSARAAVHRLGARGPVLVADLGGGGTEVALVDDGEVLTARAIAVGAEVLDDALAQLVLDRARPELAQRIRFGEDADTHRAWYALRTGVRSAKETLGATGSVDVALPAHPPVRLVHDDLARLLGPGLEEIAAGIDALHRDHTNGDRPALLVRGGLAELPRVREWLGRRTGLTLAAADPGATGAHGPVSGAAAMVLRTR